MWKDLAVKKLRESNLKLTPQRLKLIEAIDRMGNKHPSINELYEEIRSDFPTMSFSTLYSNLLILKGLNLINFFSLEGETKLEINVEPHFNVINPEEKKIEDFVDEKLIEEVERKIGKRVRFVNVFVE